MPEGDTIYRAARTLSLALAGKIVTRFHSVYPALTRVDEDGPLAGRTVEKVESIGKHLLMHFSGGLVLRTHMRMNGSWHIYRPGERWRRAHREMRVVIATADFEAVAFNVPVAEFVDEADIPKHETLARLGPDLLDPDFDEEDACRRLRAAPGKEIAEALLDQRLMAGAGNVYKSEILFLCRVNPFTLVQNVDDQALTSIVGTARKLLNVNVTTQLAPMTTYTGYRRTTRRDAPTERLWVYGRGGRPCRRCGTAIDARKQGDGARLTYWCPTCQTS